MSRGCGRGDGYGLPVSKEVAPVIGMAASRSLVSRQVGQAQVSAIRRAPSAAARQADQPGARHVSPLLKQGDEPGWMQ